ncbi:flagellar protein FliI [Erythrobacter sp. SG61-1L]|uniref:FliI/YscN family ATPase n=1 Tax=Erythrobacter sp. SG61-1L TaxID=1603897 RepID=UPI0006C92FAD|nr:FliI/YscN family ATPase [Erythrobacter sp. SG61-1L]KPL68263.1 flagellar protein FliI [Erythrobacter sp. SG61-1L]
MRAHPFLVRLGQAEFARATGRLTRITGEFLEADGPIASVGDYCEVGAADASDRLLAEVVAVEAEKLRLVPIGPLPRLALGAALARAHHVEDIPVGSGFGGRAVDALARPLDGKAPIHHEARQKRAGRPLPPLDRVSPAQRIETGIRAIDALLPLGEGQRVGIFAAAGVGKTSLLEQIARQSACDRVVLCLVGERGREVDVLWQMLRESTNSARSTLIAATADESPSLRLRAIEQAVGLAEHWRDEGEHVLLLVDSITRVAHALRELGLAAGLPPSVRGLTPNVFSALPRLVERCGASRSGGAITAVFTVLSETDDVDDPVVELMKSVLDGHIVLSRQLAEKRHFPAIDLSRSVSRLAGDLLDEAESSSCGEAHALVATYEEARPMIESGLYRSGASDRIDRAIALQPALTAFLGQGTREHCGLQETHAALTRILSGGSHA